MTPASLSFVELTVRDADASAAWYGAVLGLGEAMRDEANGFVLLTAGTARLALKTGEPTAGPLLAFEVADLDEWLAHARRCGVALEGDAKTSAEGYRCVALRDLDGYAVRVFAWLDAVPGRRP